MLHKVQISNREYIEGIRKVSAKMSYYVKRPFETNFAMKSEIIYLLNLQNI